MLSQQQVLSYGREVLSQESQAIKEAGDRLGQSFFQAVNLLFTCKGKVVTTGMGKSGNVAQKVAATLSSTGTPSFFLHPSEALHGDFGMVGKEDCLLAFAQGGETREVLAVVQFARSMSLPVVAVTGKNTSSLASRADACLDSGVDKEADLWDMAPTSSSTVALALGDALAVVLMRARNFSREHFLRLHPGGRLGRSQTCTSDLMQPLSELCVLYEDSTLTEAVAALSTPNFGLAPVVKKDTGELQGILSDGDLRRALERFGPQLFQEKVMNFMTGDPKVVSFSSQALDAIHLMERHKITSVFVVDGKELKGLLRLHDLISSNLL